nr:uncharacterized protein LOC105055471 isoform X2 [Elaeis guineensis]
MGFLQDLFFGGEKDAEMEDETVPNPIPLLSSIANSVVYRCSRILLLPMEQLQQHFEADLPDHVKQPSLYARNLVEYCSFKALHVDTKRPDHLADKDFCRLTYDMMLAWEVPDKESESLPKETAFGNDPKVEDDDRVSLFYESVTRMASQVDGKKTVGLEAFARIAPACPALADPITVHNLFDALTMSSGRLHFLIYDKYLKSLDKVLKSAKCMSGPPHASSLQLADGEIILDVDGVMPTKPVLQHIGMSTWPGRLTLTTHALYFESLGVGSYSKAVRYDLAKDLKQMIKRELTGPWGARLFDNAVMYKSNSLAEPIFLEFPQIKGHARRDYWFAIIREVLHVHKFIRKFNLKKFQHAEALSKATLGIFRYRAVKEAFHIIPSHFKTILAFNLSEKLPKGDKILKALYKHLELLHGRFLHHDAGHDVVETSSDEKPQTGSFPVSLCTLTRMGILLHKEDHPEERYFLDGDVHVGETSSLQKAIKESVCYSGRVEAARATLDQVTIEDIDTNVAVVKELTLPLVELGKRLLFLAEWEDPLKSTVFLMLILYVVYRGWVRYILPCTFLSLATFMLCHKHQNKAKPLEAFQITPPPNRNPVEQLVTLQEVVSQLETNVQAAVITLLKIRGILYSAFPQTTNKVAITLITAAVLFAFVPFKHIVLLVLLEAYTREMPLRKNSSEKLKRRIREWWVRIPAAPVQVVRTKEHKKLKTASSLKHPLQ